MDYLDWKVVKHFDYFRNIAGTNFNDRNDGGWVDLLTSVMEPKGIHTKKCIVEGCRMFSEVGSHIEIFVSDQIGIVPMCRNHNNLSEGLGVIKKKRNYAAYVMPIWRQNGFKMMEQMFLGYIEKDVIVNNIRYAMTNEDSNVIIDFPNAEHKEITKYLQRYNY